MTTEAYEQSSSSYTNLYRKEDKIDELHVVKYLVNSLHNNKHILTISIEAASANVFLITEMDRS